MKPMIGLFAGIVVVIAASKFAYDAKTDIGDEPVNAAWAQGKMEFLAWNNEKWTAWVQDDMFDQVPQNNDLWTRHSNASLAFTNWEGESWQAKIDGDIFLLAHQGDWQGTVEKSDAIRFRDWSGNNQLRTVADLRR